MIRELAVLVLLSSVPPLRGADEPPFGLARRIPWTTSRVVGSPEPPDPYRVEIAFSNLKFTEPLAIERIPGTDKYSDLARHPENEALPGTIAFRPHASLLYINAEAVRDAVLTRLRHSRVSEVKLVVCDLSTSPFIDLAGSRMLHDLHSELTAQNVSLRVVGAHGYVRDLLRADGLADKVGGLDRSVTLDSFLVREATS